MPATYADHRAQLKAILRGWDMPEDNAEITAEVLAWSDLHGVDSHGMSMVPGYDQLRRRGRANMQAIPKIIKETPVSALVDGDGGLGHGGLSEREQLVVGSHRRAVHWRGRGRMAVRRLRGEALSRCTQRGLRRNASLNVGD